MRAVPITCIFGGNITGVVGGNLLLVMSAVIITVFSGGDTIAYMIYKINYIV